MKALLFKDTAKSSIEEVERPTINESEILLKVKACAICGTDIKLNKGSSTKLTKDGIKNMPFPRITGHEFSGTVEEIGKKVEGFNIGDRINVSPVIPCMVCNFCKKNHQEICDNKVTIGFDIDGAFAEYIKIPDIAIKAGCVNKIGKGISFEEATLTEPLAVVLNSQERSKIGSKDTVIIIGAGPIGLLQIQVARYNGASKIIVADISEDRLDYAKEFDPDVLVNNSKEDLKKIISDATNGNGADVVLICASAKALFSDCLEYTNKLGRINYFAGLSKDGPLVEINANLVHYNELTITGTSDSTPKHNKMAMELINTAKIDVKSLISHRFSIKDYFRGLDMAQSGKAIKVIISF